jgi:hypothetical protein
MTLKAGWLDRQFARVNEEVREWPPWMRREAGFTEPSTPETDHMPESKAQTPIPSNSKE